MDTTPLKAEALKTGALFEPGRSIAWDYVISFDYPWEALPGVGECIIKIGKALKDPEYNILPGNVWIHNTATVAPSAYIGNNVIICAEACVRHCAFIRENALVGAGAVVGNSTELKNAILFDGVQVPHYNYVGDSILGYKSHMGAGAITSNIKSDRTPVSVSFHERRVETGLKKFGAILGDHVEVGCNSVLNPGCVIGPGTTVYPLSMVRGFIPGGSIYKKQGEVAEKS